MNIPRPIDHELVTLLHEITDDPAKLMAGFTNRLRTTKHELPKTLGLDEDAFFNQSERRLLRRHREEIGDLLYERCLQFMQSIPTEQSRIEWSRRSVSPDVVARRQQCELHFMLDKRLVDTVEVEERLIAPIKSDNISAVLELSLRLRPCFRTASAFALALKEDEHYALAEDLLKSFDRITTPFHQKSILLNNRAFVACAKRELDDARRLLRKAHYFDVSRASITASWATLELCCGTKLGIIDSATALQENADYIELDFDLFVLGLAMSSSDFRPFINPSQLKTNRSMSDKLPERARKLANAIG